MLKLRNMGGEVSWDPHPQLLNLVRYKVGTRMGFNLTAKIKTLRDPEGFITSAFNMILWRKGVLTVGEDEFEVKITSLRVNHSDITLILCNTK